MKVIGKQKNSKMCYICGMDNSEGLKSQFYNMEDESVITVFKYRPEHQSFPQRVHGGLLSAMLDELAFRGCWVKDETVLGATTSMEIKFRKPAPYDVDLIGQGVILNETSRFIKAKAQIMDRDGVIFTDAVINYIKLPVEKIAENVDFHSEICYLIEDGIKEIDINEKALIQV